MDDHAGGPARLPAWLRVLGAIAFAGTVALAGRLAWEQTVWSWERGPQMVGFSLAHSGAAILLLAPPVLVFCSNVDLVEFLIAKGADVNAVDRSGDSSLELAVAGQHDAAARILAAHGATRIRGDELRRKRASEDSVHEDMAEIDRMFEEARRNR